MLGLTAATAAWAQGAAREPAAPTAARGLELAQKLCTSCHLVDTNASPALPAGIPTFHSIANRPDQTGQRIFNVLIKPHAPMPDLQLSNEEINNIIAFLETLRSDKSGPPLTPPTKPGQKPNYPEPT